MNPNRPVEHLPRFTYVSNSKALTRGRFASAFILIMVLCMVPIGCGGGAVSEDADQMLSMRGLAVAYGQFISQHRGRPPKSEKDLRKFIESNGPKFLESYGVESVDELLTSPRDGEPYVVVYKKRAKVVAYESVGLEGMRFVADDLGIVEEMDEAAFAEAVPDAK